MNTLVQGILALLLVAILAFGGLAHALLPHQHSPNEAVKESLHSAFVHEEYFLPVVVSVVAFVFFVLATTTKGEALRYALVAASRTTSAQALRRGIEKYRRFR